MWKNLSKLFLGVMACMSIAFSGLASDALSVHADDQTDYPYQIGLYDVVDFANYTVTYQTWRVKISSSEGWTMVNYNNGWYRFDYALVKAGTSTNVDFILRGLFDDYPKNVGGYSKSVIVNTSLSIKTNEYSSLNALDSALQDYPITLVYKTATPIANGNPYNAAGTDPYQWGFVEGYNYAVESDFDQKTGVYIQWDTSSNSSRVFSVVVYDENNDLILSESLSYYRSVVYFERPNSKAYKFGIVSTDDDGFMVKYSSRDYPDDFQTITEDMKYSGVYWLPTWEGGITLTVFPSVTGGFATSYLFGLDQNMAAHVGVSSTYAAGYRAGYLAGQEAGNNQVYQSGYSDGRNQGYSNGYGDGRSIGYAEGYSYAADNNVGSPTMINIWPLMSAVISMPFTFFQNGLDWTLFEGSPYEFSVSVFFGSLFVILMMWKIVQLIWRFGK